MNYEILQMRIEKIAQNAVFQSDIFFVEPVAQKNQNIVITRPSTPYFSSQFLKTFVTHPPNINELDTVVTPTPVL